MTASPLPAGAFTVPSNSASTEKLSGARPVKVYPWIAVASPSPAVVPPPGEAPRAPKAGTDAPVVNAALARPAPSLLSIDAAALVANSPPETVLAPTPPGGRHRTAQSGNVLPSATAPYPLMIDACAPALARRRTPENKTTRGIFMAFLRLRCSMRSASRFALPTSSIGGPAALQRHILRWARQQATLTFDLGAVYGKVQVRNRAS
jgi:hypothetical protein